jgi:hypothetical protein
MAIGVPGCPELAACTASMANVRIVLILVSSIGVAVAILLSIVIFVFLDAKKYFR